MKKYDLIAIGDITNDAFIKLNETSAHANLNNQKTELCLSFGEKLPYDFLKEVNATGNAANASIVAKRLGLNIALITNLGDDEKGVICKNKLESEGINTEFIKTHTGIKTNYNFVLWYKTDRTILVRHENYPYELPDFNPPEWIYLTSLGENAENYYKEIENYLASNTDVNLAFQPGTFQIKLGVQKLKTIYERTNLLVVNKEEAKKLLETDDDDIKNLLSGLKNLGPKTIIITDGENGAYMLLNDKTLFIPIYKNETLHVDSTGAGDVFAGTMTALMALGKTPEEAFLRAPINANFVMTKVGAQDGILTLDQIEEYLQNAPADYKISEI